jgi:hypothetical protein
MRVLKLTTKIPSGHQSLKDDSLRREPLNFPKSGKGGGKRKTAGGDE